MSVKILRAAGDLLQAVADEMSGDKATEIIDVLDGPNKKWTIETKSFEIDAEDEEMQEDESDDGNWDPDRKESLIAELNVERRCRVYYQRTSSIMSPEGAAANLIMVSTTPAEAHEQVEAMRNDPLVTASGKYCDYINALLEWAAGKGDSRPGGAQEANVQGKVSS